MEWLDLAQDRESGRPCWSW